MALGRRSPKSGWLRMFSARCHIEGTNSVTRRALARSYESSVEGPIERRTSRMVRISFAATLF